MLTDSYINHLTGGNGAAIETDGDNAVRLACQQWQAIHSGAVLMAAAAIAEKSWAHLRQAEEIMASAKAGFDPLVVAIMGNRAPDLSNRLMQALHQAGTHATSDQLAAARKIIKANREQMEARRAVSKPVIKKGLKAPRHEKQRLIVGWLTANGDATPDEVAVALNEKGIDRINVLAAIQDGVIHSLRGNKVGV